MDILSKSINWMEEMGETCRQRAVSYNERNERKVKLLDFAVDIHWAQEHQSLQGSSMVLLSWPESC